MDDERCGPDFEDQSQDGELQAEPANTHLPGQASSTHMLAGNMRDYIFLVIIAVCITGSFFLYDKISNALVSALRYYQNPHFQVEQDQATESK